MTDPSSHSRFLALPAEIRESVYKLILHPANNRIDLEDDYIEYSFSDALVLFRINRQIYHESRKVFRDLNVFVRIETPWDQAQEHVAMEGHVPIIVSGSRAAAFDQHSLQVQIDAPQSPMLQGENQRFIVLLDDLERFTRVWYYADLTHPHLNGHLSLKLTLRDPHAAEYDEPRMSKALQRRLLLPFGMVKNLHETVIAGGIKPFASVESELRAEQSTPHASPESCLREATRHKLEGNTALVAGDVPGALAHYNKAWRALHIVVHGRQRHIHADQFFMRILTEPPYTGKHGQTERLILRVQLVANTCQAYLKAEQYEECIHWGMRTIAMLRQGMGADDPRIVLRPEDEAFLNFPAADQMGKIYYRTALAYKELGDDGEARRLLRVAIIYLPRDEHVKKAVAATALRLG